MATKKKQPKQDEFPFQGSNSAKCQAAKRMAKALLKGQDFNTTSVRPKKIVDAVFKRHDRTRMKYFKDFIRSKAIEELPRDPRQCDARGEPIKQPDEYDPDVVLNREMWIDVIRVLAGTRDWLSCRRWFHRLTWNLSNGMMSQRTRLPKPKNDGSPPGASAGKRILAWIAGWLPIESQL